MADPDSPSRRLDRDGTPQLADPHCVTVPAVSVVRAVSEKGWVRVDDESLIRADVAAKAIWQMKELLIELTEDRLGRDGAERLAEELVSGRYTHDYPLTPNKRRGDGDLGGGPMCLRRPTT